MPEYISREAALKAIYTSTAPALEVKAMPAADVVEVVRCWECINRSSKFSTGREYYCMKSGVFRSLEFFCADGKRKDGKWLYCPYCGSKNQDGGQDDV